MYLCFDFFDQEVVVHVDSVSSSSSSNFCIDDLVTFFSEGSYRPRPSDFIFLCAVPDSYSRPDLDFSVPVLYFADDCLFYY